VGMLTEYDPSFFGRTTSKNNSLTVSFLCKRSTKMGILVHPEFSVYYRAKPTYQEVLQSTRMEEGKKIFEMPKVWKRFDFVGGGETFQLGSHYGREERGIDVSEIVDVVNRDPDAFRGGSKVLKEALVTKEAYRDWLRTQDSVKPRASWICKLSVERNEFSQGERGLDIIHVQIVNLTPKHIGKRGSFEPSLFNCRLQIDILSGRLEKFVYNYEFEGFPESFSSYVRANNCHAEYDPATRMTTTKGFAEYTQHKVLPTNSFTWENRELRPKFEELSTHEGTRRFLEKMTRAMKQKQESYSQSPQKNEPRFRRRLELFSENLSRFQNGFNTLLEDRKAMRAFNLMNTTFSQACEYDCWRLFQIHFIVSCIPDVLDLSAGSKTVDVLHVATGGGKSEAYFGLVVFCAFYDRLTGKRFGTTAITKFPLRMLSVQQLERIAKIFAYAERTREEEHVGGEPFSVAYFVGSTTGEFPRRSTKMAQKLNDGVKLPGRIVRTCPFAGCLGTVSLRISERDRGIIHYCESCKSTFRIYITDEETYRFIPTFIVSTVDKHAGYALQRRYRNILGGSLSECERGHGYMPRGDTCEVEDVKKGEVKKCGSHGSEVQVEFSTAPRVIIQDEMHLIKEGFGTIDSHFETAIEETAKGLAGHGFKNIAMTATIAGAAHQVKELYGKDSRIVPGQPPEGYAVNDFFFDTSLNEKGEPEIQRIHIGLRPNNRDNQFACLLSLRHLANILAHIRDNARHYARKSGYATKDILDALEDYECFLTYHNKKQDVHSMSYFLRPVVNAHLQNLHVKGRVLTGEKDLDYIKETIAFVKSHSFERSQTFHATFATSVVSHGVDIDRWNVMLFQGIPRSTSEYIQAFSRTGRKRTGLSLVWFYPTRTRDISFFRNFQEYHRVLEHKVEHVPISRFAPLGLDQTLTSILSGSILNYLSHSQRQPLYRTRDVVSDVVKVTTQRERLIAFVESAYRVGLGLRGQEDFRRRIPQMVEDRLNYLDRYIVGGGREIYYFPNALKDSRNHYYRTQYGMRGIQDEVSLIPADAHLRTFSAFRRRS
ncbi:MAG: helicase-related protein, partial [Thermoplasmata archaeon]